MKDHKGFSLIELLITLVIFSLLITVAVPGFQDQLRQTRREDARHLLLLNAQRLQRCFTLEGIYNGNCATRTASKGGYYTLESTLNSDTFLLTAKPVAGTSQAKDADCLTLTYDNTGRKEATGEQKSKCW